MHRLSRTLLAGATAFALLSPLAHAGDIDVSDARVRLLPGDVPSAGYFSLHNGSDRTVTLVGASSDAFGQVMMHKSMEKDGMAHMHAVPSLEVAAGEDIDFAPSGYHLMLMKRSAPLAIGEQVTITLEFEQHPAMPVTFEAVSPADM
ncbi:copper chaperone PCu(A)C [Marinobacter bohaiensis]|uniref:copper chaperone PCu(A)C n=1 Tax=Marinobacter bohaiensis TaxID=2201898 RepID=UPI000DAD7352|nr:copper chaperone PCu(A)C [Marinobacter bohaiensis]